MKTFIERLNRSQGLGLAVIVSIALFFTVLAVLANSDLTAGRHVLFMDEHITFDGVRKILHPESLEDFFYQVLLGKDHRYGRVLWNVSALFSAIPEHYWGIKGQIIATRMVQYAALLAGCLILSLTFLRSWPFRALGLLLLLALPTTDYYASMPKPEPLQFLFLSLFLWRARKNGFAFGWHWIFLGLAFGAKISVLLLLPVFAILGFLVSTENRSITHTVKKLSNAGAAFIVGFFISEPINLMSILFRTIKPTETYIRHTFKNTGHGRDDASIGLAGWISHLINKYTTMPSFMVVVTAIAAFIVVLIVVRELYHDYPAMKPRPGNGYALLIDKYSGLLLLLAGFILIFPVMLTVRRIWDFYLHSGICLMGIGVVAMIEGGLALPKESSGRYDVPRLASLCLLLLLTFQTLFFLVPGTTRDFLELSRRTESAEYKKKLYEYEYLSDMFTAVALKMGRPLSVYLDPHMFDLDSNDYFTTKKFWGPFVYWSEEFDFVLYYKKDHAPEGDIPPPTSVEYDQIVKERAMSREHISGNGGDCLTAPCYGLVKTPLEDVSVLLRKDLYDALSGGSRQ